MSDATHKAAAMSEPRWSADREELLRDGEWTGFVADNGTTYEQDIAIAADLAARLNRLDAAEALIREMAGALRDLLTASWDDSERHNAAAEAAVAKADVWLAQEGGGRAD